MYNNVDVVIFGLTVEEEQRELALIKEGSTSAPPTGSAKVSPTQGQSPRKIVTIRVESEENGSHLTVPNNMNASSSAETLTGKYVVDSGHRLLDFGFCLCSSCVCCLQSSLS